MPQQDLVVIVNEQDDEIGVMEKLAVHKHGVLHRAFSVIVFNEQGAMLLQKRALSKYHSGGLWSNTCCSHPMPGEPLLDAAKRRLKEEMGMECHLKHTLVLHYRAALDNDLIEHEMDHVFIGVSHDKPVINTDEVEDWCYMPLDELQLTMQQRPKDFTVWFHLLIERLGAEHLTYDM